eukprot:TRINITY_DN5283_c0_g1_i1.p1 TRINITY_DN5283_c0_g1~~TRINITY_DN5283_c0_g1_i1.p1  ORF type:complete len:917 (+),score=174.90 TRINITY_DN5283_c0_g1_i1:387-2753(+)
MDEDAFKASASKNIEKVVNKSMAKLNVSVDKFMVSVSPALGQVSDWLSGFGEKIQDSLEEFGTTVDRSQKIFDQVTSKISLKAASPEDEKEILDQTFQIFDTDGSGAITIVNMHQIADLYGITALQGKKAESLMDKYNTDTKSGREIDRDEYEGLVKDDSLPNLMVNILRKYTKKLSVIGGSVGLASMRAELAESMVDYVSLVSAKNLTKIEVLTRQLVDQSSVVPVEFLADIWYEFRQNSHSPDNSALVDIGQLFANDSIKLGPERTLQAINELCNCTFYAAEGFAVEDQDDVVKEVVTWVSNAPGGKDALKKYGKIENTAGNWADSYYNYVHEKSEKYMKAHTAASGNRAMGSTASTHARELQEALLGGKSAAANGQDPDADRVSGSGQPARPETLAFAKEFSQEILDDAHDKNKLASDFSGTSSDALDSVANDMSGMVKKTQSFLTTMDKFAGPQGQDNLKKEANNFIHGTSRDILTISNSQIDRAVDTAKCTAGDQLACENGGKKLDMPMQMSGAMVFLTSTTSELKSALPTVIDNLKFAKKEVSAVSSAIKSIMQMLGLKAPPIFKQISKLYKLAWIGYFSFFFLFTFTMLFYAFWSSGWFGGPQANVASPDYEPPQTFGQRLRTCCNSCLACVNGCCSGHLVFWSCMLLAQVIVLLLFITSLVICLLTGVQAFLGAGCAQIYLIGDDDVCSAALNLVKIFLRTFAVKEVPDLDDVCSRERLLTCALIRDEIQASAIKVIIGAMLASVLSFQMLLDSATKHERARCIRLLDEDEKKGLAASSS